MGATVEKIHMVTAIIAAGSGSATVTLPSTFDPTKSFCILEHTLDANVQNDGIGNFARADLASNGNSVTITRNSATYASRYSLIVVCLKGGRVQKILSTPDLSSGATTYDVAIPFALKDVTKTFVLTSFYLNTVDLARIPLPSSFPNTTTLRLTRSNTFSASVWMAFYVVEFE